MIDLESPSANLPLDVELSSSVSSPEKKPAAAGKPDEEERQQHLKERQRKAQKKEASSKERQSYYFRLVFINIQFLVLVLGSQWHHEVNLVELVYLVVGLIMTRLKTIQARHKGSEQQGLLDKNPIFIMAFHRHFKSVFIFQVVFHGIYLVVKLILVFYLFNQKQVDPELQNFLDIHPEMVYTFLPQTCIFIFNIVALSLFGKVSQSKKRLKQSLSTEYQITKIMLLFLLTLQPCLNVSLLSLSNVLMIPLVFCMFFLKAPVPVLQSINIFNSLTFLLQNLYQSPFFTFNSQEVPAYISMTNQLFIILVIDKEITKRSQEDILAQMSASEAPKKKKFVPKNRKAKAMNAIFRVLSWVNRLITDSRLLNYHLSNFFVVMLIQRYLSYISLAQMFFLFLSFYKDDLQYRFFLLTVFIIPISFLRLIIQYLYNICYESQYMIGPMDKAASLFEFVRIPDILPRSNLDIEYFIQISVVFLQFIVVYGLHRQMVEKQQAEQLQVRQNMKQPDEESEPIQSPEPHPYKKPRTEQVLRALFIKLQYIGSFLFSMLTIFYISLSAVNIFHFVIATFFLFILLHLNTEVFSSSQGKMTLYWRRLIQFTQVILFSRYFYELQVKSTQVIDEKWLEFMGLNYTYNLFSLSIGFNHHDYGSNTLTWIMYINCVQFYMQSKDFEASNTSQQVLRQVTNQFVTFLRVLFHKTFVYQVYFATLLVIICTEPSAITILLFICILVPFNKFFQVMNVGKTHLFYQNQGKHWKLNMIVFSVVTMIIYTYQFFSTRLLATIAANSSIIQWLNNNHYVGLQIYIYKNPQGEQVNNLRKMMLPYYSYLLISVIMIKQLSLHCRFMKQSLKQDTDQMNTFLHQRKKSQLHHYDDSQVHQVFLHDQQDQRKDKDDLDEHEMQFLAKEVNPPLLKGKKRINKAVYKVFCLLVSLSIVPILMLTTDSTLFAIVVSLIYFYFMRQFLLDYHTLYDQTKNNEVIQQRFQQFEQHFLSRDSFYQQNYLEIDDPLSKYVEEYHQTYIRFKYSQTRSLMKVLFYFAQIVLFMTFFAVGVVDRLQESLKKKGYSADTFFTICKIVGLINPSEDAHQPDITHYSRQSIAIYYTILWIVILSHKMVQFIQDYNDIKADLKKKKRLSSINIFKKNVKEIIKKQQFIKFSQEVGGSFYYTSPESLVLLDEEYEVDSEHIEVVPNYIDSFLIHHPAQPLMTQRHSNVGEGNFNYFKFQYFFFNRSLLQDQLLKCVLLQLVDILPHLMMLVFSLLFMDAFSLLYLLFGVAMLQLTTYRSIRIVFFVVLILQRVVSLLNFNALSQLPFYQTLMKYDHLIGFGQNSVYQINVFLIYFFELALVVKIWITYRISKCLHSRFCDFSSLQKQFKNVNVNYTRWNESKETPFQRFCMQIVQKMHLLTFIIITFLCLQSINITAMLMQVLFLYCIYVLDFRAKQVTQPSAPQSNLFHKLIQAVLLLEILFFMVYSVLVKPFGDSSISKLFLIELIQKQYTSQQCLGFIFLIIMLQFQRNAFKMESYQSYHQRVRSNIKIKSILRAFHILREKNMGKINRIYANYFRKDNLMQEINSLTAKYQKIFQNIEGKEHSKSMGVSELLKQEMQPAQENRDAKQTGLGQQMRDLIRQYTNTYLFKDKMTLYAQFMRVNSDYTQLQDIHLLDIMCENNAKILSHVRLVQQDYERFHEQLLQLDKDQDMECIQEKVEALRKELRQRQRYANLDPSQGDMASYEDPLEPERSLPVEECLKEMDISSNQLIRNNQQIKKFSADAIQEVEESEHSERDALVEKDSEKSEREENLLEKLCKLNKTQEEEGDKDAFSDFIISPQKVQLFNINPNEPESLLVLTKHCIQSRVMSLLVILIMFYRFENIGLASFIPILLCIFLILLQDQYYRSTYVKTIFFVVSGLITLKQLQNLLRLIYEDGKKVQTATIFLGTHHGSVYEMCLVITLVLTIDFLARQGLFSSRNLRHYDDIYRTFFSLKRSDISSLLSESDHSSEADLSLQKMQKDFLTNLHLMESSGAPSYLQRNFSSLNMRGGYNFYSIIMCIQLVIFVYIFVFFKKLKREKPMPNGQMQLVTNEFDASMLLMSTYHLTCIVLDRIINQRRYKFSIGTYRIVYTNETVKFFFLVVQVVVFILFSGFYLPTNWFSYQCYYPPMNNHKVELQCSFVSINLPQKFLYLLETIYFVVSAVQIRNGYALFKMESSLTKYNNEVNLYIFMAYRFIPFLYEIQLVLDWTITKTSLTLTQWFNINEVHSKFYISKVTFIALQKKQLGEPVNKLVKFGMGVVGLLTLLGIIYGPLFLFSNLNPTQEANPITNVQLSFGVIIHHTNYHQLYSNKIMTTLTQVDHTKYKASPNKFIKQLKPDQFQMVRFNSFSDEYWISTSNVKHQLIQQLEYIAKQSQDSVQLKMDVIYTRQKDKDDTVNVFSNSQSISGQQINQFISLLQCSPDIMNLNGFMNNTIFISKMREPYIIGETLPRMQQSTIPNWTMSCQKDQHGSYFSIQDNLTPEGSISLFMVTDEFSSITQGMSVMVFYTSIIYVLGASIRNGIVKMSSDLALKNIPKPDNLIKICNAINMARDDQNLVLENTLYWYLIDILRSPEMIKQMTGSLYSIITAKKKFNG